VNCGVQTEVIKKDLSSMKSLQKTWDRFSAKKSVNIPAAGASIILGILPTVLLIWLFNGLLNQEAVSGFQLVKNLLIRAFAYSLFIPFIAMAFSGIRTSNRYSISIKEYFTTFRKYPRYFMLALISSLTYVLFYIICFGLPNFGSDPILSLVWIVLLNYWAAILLPVPMICETLNVNAYKAIGLSMKHLQDVRWNIYLMVLVLGVINVMALLLFVFGLLVTIPLTWFAIRDYTYTLIDYELLEYQR
jgi:hypothetical protein